MSERNPYDAPKASVSHSTNETYQPSFFSTKGRIGRVRYLAYSFGLYLLVSIPFGVMFSFIGVDGKLTPVYIMLALFYIIVAIGYTIFTKRRFNDLNKSGWLSLTMLIPFVNIITGIYVTFFPGTKGSNKYGPKPKKNTFLLWLAGLIPIIAVIVILAAVALPAYNDYVERAKAAESISR